MFSASGDPEIFGVRRSTWLATLLFTFLTVVLAYPISIHPSTLRFTTGPDGDLGWYLLGWNTHAFLHKPWAIFDANIYYPERFTLAYGENVIGIALFAAPVIWLGGHLLLAANFVCLLATMLCGLAAFILARRVGLSVAAALIAGIIFQCSPPRFLRIGQMNLASVQWIPFTFAALHSYFETGRRRDLRLAAAFVSLQVLSSGHGAVFLAVGLLVFFGYRVLLGEPLRPLQRLRDLGLTGALLLLPSVLVFVPYLIVQKEVGLRRGLGTWIANNQSFLASPSHAHRYLLDLFELSHLTSGAGAFLFPGYLPLLLAVAALLWHRQAGRSAAADHQAVRAWVTPAALLELALIMVAVVAGALTAGTLIERDAGASLLAEPRSAVRAWSVFLFLAVIGLAIRNRVPPETFSRHRRPVTFLVAMAICWTALASGRPLLRAGDGLSAEYFANPHFTGPPALTAPDDELSTARMAARWGGRPPGQFSVRWMGFLAVGRTGQYTFALTSDDGSQLVIDGALVIDNSGVHPSQTRSATVRLDAGSHAVIVRYVQEGNLYDLGWTWGRDGAAPTVVPSWALSQRKTSVAAARAARGIAWGMTFFGIATVLAAAWYISVALKRGDDAVGRWADARRRSVVGLYGTLTLVSFGLTLGPPYGLWRWVYALPLFSFIRVNTRFTLLTLVGLAILAAVGFDRIGGRLPRRARTILATVLAVLLVVEFAAMPLRTQPGHVDIPAIDRWLNTRPKPFVIAEVPVDDPNEMGAFEWTEVTYMIHSTAHFQKTVHGYSGWRTAFHHRLFAAMENFPDEPSMSRLLDVGVTYVVVHTDRYRPGEWPRVEERIGQYSSNLKLERVEGAGRVYSLIRGPLSRD